jgi:predicted GNAT family acetyltransferase
MVPERIQQYLRSVVAREREPNPAGGFVLYLHPTDPHPFLNYAIPSQGATDWDATELIRVAQMYNRVPRLEYLESCFPSLAAALSAQGFGLEARHRLMTCSADAINASPMEFEIQRVAADSALVPAMLTVTRGAFGEGPPDDSELAGWDGRAVAALVGGEVVGGARWTAVIDEMSEIAGVGVAYNARRRGIGAALTAAAARGAFAEGASLVLLTPGSDATARVYARAGFQDATTMLHLRYEKT